MRPAAQHSAKFAYVQIWADGMGAAGRKEATPAMVGARFWLTVFSGMGIMVMLFSLLRAYAYPPKLFSALAELTSAPDLPPAPSSPPPPPSPSSDPPPRPPPPPPSLPHHPSPPQALPSLAPAMSAVTAKHIETGGKSRESRKFEAFPSPWMVHAPCLDESLVVNDAGGGRTPPRFFYSNAPIPVHHHYAGDTGMEASNLWMNLPLLARKVRAGQLFYIPGRVIAFPDLTDMLYSIHAHHRWKSPFGTPGTFDKADAMRLLSSHYGADFESIMFLGHFDANQACNRTCCPHGRSKLNQVLVALRGWDVHACPGHANLSRFADDGHLDPCACSKHEVHEFC